ALHAAFRQVRASASVRVLLLRGQGPAFCGGFDLAACVEQPALLRELVHGLSAAVQTLRALAVPVVAQVQGAALAGGCALLSGCDFVVVAPDAQLGYPVHRIGVSPAVSLPGVMANAGAGRAREIAMGGTLYVGAEAVRVGLATHCAPDAGALAALTQQLCERLAAKGPRAMQATKAWLNELDGTADATRFAHTAAASAAAAEGDEFAAMLRAFWAKRTG
ncbi:MAG: enoyl-CoA hydratase/isomerase family protein, partial [Phycisphaerae bacterium]|nr:enoyl-CoA hydratase/isomerase family protein [Phycisphaerae bacterium]